jgi:hypothetical protein
MYPEHYFFICPAVVSRMGMAMTDLPSAGRALDALVHMRVFAVPAVCTTMGAELNHKVYEDVPHYSTDIAAAWLAVLLMVSRMGYDNIGFAWQGPLFKPEHHYLTREGYPLGTTCWFVRIECDGYIKNVCADTPALAICRAALDVSLREPAK